MSVDFVARVACALCGDQARAVEVFNEGRIAGADKWLFMSSAAQAADQRPTDQQSTDSR